MPLADIDSRRAGLDDREQRFSANVPTLLCWIDNHTGLAVANTHVACSQRATARAAGLTDKESTIPAADGARGQSVRQIPRKSVDRHHAEDHRQVNVPRHPSPSDPGY